MGRGTATFAIREKDGSKAPTAAAAAAGAAATSAAVAPGLRFEGCRQFRQRLTFATLARKRLRVDNIRHLDEEPGLQDFEASYLRLLDSLTNGSKLEINETGTCLRYNPGLIIGGSVEHACGLSRSIGWFIEGVLPLLPFAKKATTITFTGITNDDTDFTVDTLRLVTLPLLAHFGLAEGLSVTIKKRGLRPGGGGQVILTCPSVRELTPVSLTDEGLIRKVRGVAYTCRISPQVGNRCVDAARTLLLRLLPDVHIFTDSSLRGSDAGSSPGFGITLTAHSTSGCTHSAQRATGRAAPRDDDASASDGPPELPEDMGADAASRLLTEIARGGCLDTGSQPLVLTFMALCPEDVSRVRLGQLGPGAIATLRLLRDVWGIKFKLTPQAAAAGAAAPTAATSAVGGAGTGVSVSGVKRPRPSDAATATAGGDADDASGAAGAAAAAVAVDPLTGMPISADVAAPVSASTVLVSCLGLGIKNMSKKVT